MSRQGDFMIYCTEQMNMLAMKEKSTRGGYPSEPGAVGARCRNLRKGALEPDTQRGYDAYHANQGGTAGNNISRPCHYDRGGSFFIFVSNVIYVLNSIQTRSEMQ